MELKKEEEKKRYHKKGMLKGGYIVVEKRKDDMRRNEYRTMKKAETAKKTGKNSEREGKEKEKTRDPTERPPSLIRGPFRSVLCWDPPQESSAHGRRRRGACFYPRWPRSLGASVPSRRRQGPPGAPARSGSPPRGSGSPPSPTTP